MENLDDSKEKNNLWLCGGLADEQGIAEALLCTSNLSADSALRSLESYIVKREIWSLTKFLGGWGI